jgi:hypothetical protein
MGRMQNDMARSWARLLHLGPALWGLVGLLGVLNAGCSKKSASGSPDGGDASKAAVASMDGKPADLSFAEVGKPSPDSANSTIPVADGPMPVADGSMIDTSRDRALMDGLRPDEGKPADASLIDSKQTQTDVPISTLPGADAPVLDAATDPRAIDASLPVVNRCNAPDDCESEEACPADAVAGCTCVSLATGRACLPRCYDSSDCPRNDAGTLGCSAAGLCIPSSQITIDAGPRTRPPLFDARRVRDGSRDTIADGL